MLYRSGRRDSVLNSSARVNSDFEDGMDLTSNRVGHNVSSWAIFYSDCGHKILSMNSIEIGNRDFHLLHNFRNYVLICRT